MTDKISENGKGAKKEKGKATMKTNGKTKPKEKSQNSDSTPEQTAEDTPENEKASKDIRPDIQKTLTDFGNADRFLKQHGDNVRYCSDQSTWLIYSGQRWVQDTKKNGDSPKGQKIHQEHLSRGRRRESDG